MAQNQQSEEWAAELVKRVGRAIKSFRGGQTAARLSDRTAELGYRISPSVIAKLDSGHRGEILGVAELLILAAALDVPPMILLYPGLPDEKVEILPGRVGKSWTGYTWATGRDPSTLNSGAPSDGYELMRAVLERHELMGQQAALHLEASLDSDGVLKRSIEARRDELTMRIIGLNAVIRELGGVLDDA